MLITSFNGTTFYKRLCLALASSDNRSAMLMRAKRTVASRKYMGEGPNNGVQCNECHVPLHSKARACRVRFHRDNNNVGVPSCVNRIIPFHCIRLRGCRNDTSGALLMHGTICCPCGSRTSCFRYSSDVLGRM